MVEESPLLVAEANGNSYRFWKFLQATFCPVTAVIIRRSVQPRTAIFLLNKFFFLKALNSVRIPNFL
jgi:hypothetical protein